MSTPSESSYLTKLENSVAVKTKICSRKDCSLKGIPQPLDNFYERAHGSNDGRESACKTCRSSYSKKWRDKNVDYRKEKNTDWHIKNKEYVNAMRRAKRVENREHVNKVLRDWKQNNVDKVKEYYKTFHQQHPDYNKELWRKKREGDSSIKGFRSPKDTEHGSWAAKAIQRCRRRAKAKFLPFNISSIDLLDKETQALPVFCDVLGIKLIYDSSNDRRAWASVDRIIPELGYVKGNVRVISYAANMAKLDGIGDLIPVHGKRKTKSPIPSIPSLFDGL